MCRPATRCAWCCTKEASTVAWTRPGSTMTDLTFEDCLTRLEQIVSALEAGKLPLEESLKGCEEVVCLARHGASYRDESARRIEPLVKDDAAATTTRPLAWEGEDEA